MTAGAEVVVAHPIDDVSPSSSPHSPTSPSHRHHHHHKRPPFLARMCGTCCMPARVCGNCCTQPCVRAVKGRKRPSWNRKTEMAISTLRTAANALPRDAKSLRVWTDTAIPDMILPKAAVREKVTIGGAVAGQEMVCEWTWPRHLSASSEKILKGSSKSVKNFITRDIFKSSLGAVPVVLYLHGGAFCLCNSGTHRGLVYSLAIEGDMAIFVPNYRRPPEVTVKEAVEDCFAAYKYLVKDMGIDPGRICLMGDSAGGALAALTLVKIRDFGAPEFALPKCGVLLSPWVDLADDSISPDNPKNAGQVLPPYDYLPLDAIALFASESVGDHDPADPEVNVSRADVGNLPPLFINYGEVEVLRPQIETFIAKCIEAKIVVEHHMLQDMVHVGQLLAAVSKVAAAANKQVAEYVRKQIIITDQ